MSEQIQHMQRLQMAGTLASGIAHDLNNQLTLVLGHLDVALGKIPDTDPAVDSLGRARTAASHCADMSQRLLRLGRPSPRNLTRLDVATAVVETCQLLECIKPRKIKIDIDTEAGLIIEGDPTELQQILMNLATNAFQAMPSGGKLCIRAWRSPESEELGNMIKLSIRDNGKGIPVSLRQRVFEPFFTTHPENGGSGLGLSTVRSLVKGMGGHLGLDSFPGKGSTFLLLFPAAEEPIS